MNYIDNKNLEKIIDIILPKEIVYKEDKGKGVLTTLRYGIIDEELVYKNRKVINTRNGHSLFTPNVKMYFKTISDLESILTIDIFDYDTKNLLKKFIIKSLNNNFSIADMQQISNSIIDKLNSDDENKIISLIEFIRNKENLIYEEVAQ